MEKKLKINFILKGIAVFAFVAFCLLAILAGVTLPFVSNASTADGAVINAESDLHDSAVASANIVPVDYESFTTTLSNCNTTDTYYGFYITEEFYNFVKNYNFESGSPIFFGAGALGDISFLFYCGRMDNADNTLKFKCFAYSYDLDNNHYLIQSDIPFSATNRVILFNQGFKFSTIYSDNPLDEEHIPAGFKDKIKVFTSLPYKETITTVYKTNYGFESRFGYIGSLVTSNLYVSLQNNALIPDTLCRIRDSETNELINGWYINNNELYLPILDSFDEFGNSVSTAFTGWHLVNISVNGVSSSSYNVFFEVLGQRISRVGIATIVNNVVDIEAGSTPNFYVESNITNTENLLVYAIRDLPYKYNLKNNVHKDEVYKFFALIDYMYYTPNDNDYFVSGFNTASKGYYDTGYNKGYSVGKDEGYISGFTAGDSKGYQRGLSDGNNYSFLSLFGAIFDAPIQALFGVTQRLPAGTKITDSTGKTITLTSDTIVNRGGMLNFNLMGVNLSGFVLALFSLSILIVVIKFALAKR